MECEVACWILKQFWSEVLNSVVYLINRNPLVPMNKGLPEEAWCGKNVSLSHLRVIRESSYFVTFIDNYIRKV